MACNCKKKTDYIREKYGDNDSLEDEEKMGLFTKIFKFLFQIIFGILIGAIVIVMVIPMIIWLIICIMFGIQPHFKLYNITKRLKMRKEE